jgi:hypothetical protein
MMPVIVLYPGGFNLAWMKNWEGKTKSTKEKVHRLGLELPTIVQQRNVLLALPTIPLTTQCVTNTANHLADNADNAMRY